MQLLQKNWLNGMNNFDITRNDKANSERCA